MFRRKQILGYAAVSLAAFIAAIAISYAPISTSIDNYATDWMFRLHRPEPWEPKSIILAIDDASYSYIGSVSRLRGALARAIRLITPAQPKAIAIDVILADEGDFAADNEQLAQALAAAPKLEKMAAK